VALDLWIVLEFYSIEFGLPICNTSNLYPEHFHTLALEGVPIFGAHNRTSAYRFVTLVDVLLFCFTLLECAYSFPRIDWLNNTNSLNTLVLLLLYCKRNILNDYLDQLRSLISTAYWIKFSFYFNLTLAIWTCLCFGVSSSYRI